MILVIVIVVLSLWAEGVFNASSKNTTELTYDRASGLANQAAEGVIGGPWTLVAALGYDASTAVSVPTGDSLNRSCSLRGVGTESPPTELFVPSFSGSLSSGESSWWGMIYVEQSTQEVLLVQVLNGTAEALGEGSGACASEFENFTAVPSSVVDSSTAASEAWSQGGMAFEEAHGGLPLGMEMALFGGGKLEGTSFGASWAVVIDPCGIFGMGGLTGTQPEFESLLNATTGNVEFAGALSTNCTSDDPS